MRRRVETVIGQLAERFSAERIGARKLWQWVTRLYRKVAAHTWCVLINQSLGRPLLDFEGLVTEYKLHIAFNRQATPRHPPVVRYRRPSGRSHHAVRCARRLCPLG